MSWVGRPGRVWVPAGAGVLALAAAVCQVPVGRSGLGSALSAKACRPGAQHASGTVDGKPPSRADCNLSASMRRPVMAQSGSRSEPTASAWRVSQRREVGERSDVPSESRATIACSEAWLSDGHKSMSASNHDGRVSARRGGCAPLGGGGPTAVRDLLHSDPAHQLSTPTMPTCSPGRQRRARQHARPARGLQHGRCECLPEPCCAAERPADRDGVVPSEGPVVGSRRPRRTCPLRHSDAASRPLRETQSR